MATKAAQEHDHLTTKMKELDGSIQKLSVELGRMGRAPDPTAVLSAKINFVVDSLIGPLYAPGEEEGDVSFNVTRANFDTMWLEQVEDLLTKMVRDVRRSKLTEGVTPGGVPNLKKV